MAHRYMRSSNMTEFRSKSGPVTNDQIAVYAPSILADEAHESRGKRYSFIPTLTVLDGLRKEGFEPFEVRQTRVRDESRRDFTKHMVRLRHPLSSANAKGEVPEIVLLNSHDGTSSYQMMAGYFRFICSNGLIFGDMSHDIKVRHSGKVVDDVIEGAFRVVDDIKELSYVVDDYKRVPLAVPEQQLFARAALELRWDGDAAPVESERLLRPRRFEDRQDDLWTTFNRVQENLVKGGVPGRTATGRNMSTRAVAGVNENVKLNRALWALADGFAKLKAGQSVESILELA